MLNKKKEKFRDNYDIHMSKLSIYPILKNSSDRIAYKKKFLKVYFVIFNLILATFAINYLIGSIEAAGGCAGGNCPVPGMGGAIGGSTGNSGGNSGSLPNFGGFGGFSGNELGGSPNPNSGGAGINIGGWGSGGGGTPLEYNGNANSGGWNNGEGFSNGAAGPSAGSGGSTPPGGIGGDNGGFGGNSIPGDGGGVMPSPGGRVPGGGGEGLPNGGGYPGGGGVPGEGGGGYPGGTPGYGAPGAIPPTYPGSPMGAGAGTAGGIEGYFGNFMANLGQIGMGAGLGAMIGGFAGGKNGQMYGAMAGAAGVLAYQIAKQVLGLSGTVSALIGIAVFLLIFLLTYKKETIEITEFHCTPWQSPIGGEDCEKLNNLGFEIGEYTCKSLGQACDLVNKGQNNQKCIWKNPYDTNSPTIEMTEVSKGHKYAPDKTIRPPATGVEITLIGGKCIKAFTPLKFSFNTSEPAQCKIDYKLTSDSKTAYDDMGYYVGGDSGYDYNHSERLSLPGPNAIIQAANVSGLTIKNDGTYTLYIRCQDANGNVNVNPFSVRFCVDPGPDNTPPIIVNVSIPSGSPIQFNRTSVSVEVYVNEPADCKWSKEDRDYKQMEANMSCDKNLWEMNYQETYTCIAKLSGIENRKENLFYFRCMDKPDYPEEERNVNTRSYLYRMIGTQPLNIMDFGPNETISGATDLMNVTLYVVTDNGYNNGEALCYYSTTGIESDYVQFAETNSRLHKQRQDLVPGNYLYYYKCVDLGGNAAYNSTRFRIENDKVSPGILRLYKESGQIKIITNEEAECSYSNQNCNFEIDSGIKMSSYDYTNHYSEWKASKNYYVRCKDRFNNQPNPNVCTLILRPVDFISEAAMNISFEL